MAFFPLGLIVKSKYIFRVVLRRTADSKGSKGRWRQDEENCTVKQTGFSITNPGK